jgi:uncharacterized protein with beta-barrel porin domain
MRRTLRSLGAVLLFAVAVSAAAADRTSAASARTFQYDSLSRLVHASAAQADADRARYFQYDAENRLVAASAAPATGYVANDPVNHSDPDGV